MFTQVSLIHFRAFEFAEGLRKEIPLALWATVGTHSGWKVPASIDLSLASAVTFNWSESRYAALVRKGSPPRNNIIDGRFPPAVGAYCRLTARIILSTARKGGLRLLAPARLVLI